MAEPHPLGVARLCGQSGENVPQGPRPRKLTDLWRRRLEDAKLRLDFARNYKNEVERDFPTGGLPTPDGNFAHHHALRAENLALAEYNRVLRIYRHLTLHGEVPGESDFPRGKAASPSGPSAED